MAKELKFGEYALMGGDKLKRIYLWFNNGSHYAVTEGDENRFANGKTFNVATWDSAEPIDEPVYYYQWENMRNGYIQSSGYMTDEFAKSQGYETDGWKRNDSTKRTAL